MGASEAGKRIWGRKEIVGFMENFYFYFGPPFSLQHTKQHLQSDRFQPERAQAVHDLSRLLRHIVLYDKQPTDGSVREGTRLYPELCGTDAYTPAGTCETDHRHIGCHTETQVAPLLFISLIENAFKHGVSSTTNLLLST